MIQNSSGHGPMSDVPPEIRRWNWGAFLMTFIWGVANNTYIAFLVFFPFGMLIVPWLLGTRGSEWAWRNKRWVSIEAFQRTQRRWAYVGVGVALVAVLAGIAGIISYLPAEKSPVLSMAIQEITDSEIVAQLVGSPMSVSLRSVHEEGNSAECEFLVVGPKDSVLVLARAQRRDGKWNLDSVELETDEGTIDLLSPFDSGDGEDEPTEKETGDGAPSSV